MCGYGENPLRSVELIEVLEASVKIGTGTDEDPIRILVQYWTLDGRLLAEHDPLNDKDGPDL
jgi:hypothetical protein